VYAKVKEKYFRTKYKPADMLLNVNAMIPFTCKIELKFKNKNYSSMILNFHKGSNKTIRYHKIKIYEDIYHEKRTTH
jgi:hypothetical protein